MEFKTDLTDNSFSFLSLFIVSFAIRKVVSKKAKKKKKKMKKVKKKKRKNRDET